MERSTVVAIINTNPDVVRMLRTAIERAGYLVVVTHVEDIKTGQVDLQAFLRDNDPRVIVYDVAPPYEPNWRFLEHVKATPGFEGRHFVITSVNVKKVDELVGPDETVYEVVGLESDIREIVRAVKEATRARRTR
jgi:hypothetical protein